VSSRFVALVVEQDDEMRARLAEWLDDAGFTTLVCAGPRPPDFSCPGGSGLVCGLAEASDLVVLDLEMASDSLLEGPPGWQLLQYYVDTGKPVVVLADAGDPAYELRLDGVFVVHRPPLRGQLVEGARFLLRRVAMRRDEEVPDLVVVRHIDDDGRVGTHR